VQSTLLSGSGKSPKSLMLLTLTEVGATLFKISGLGELGVYIFGC